MLIERPPLIYRAFFPEAIWRIQRPGTKTAYLTFDDGPIPEVTPWVLDTLALYNVKATFFMVGENVRKHPELFERIKAEGHSYGNHTMNHRVGHKSSFHTYAHDIALADSLIGSHLFRPPHGLMGWEQARAIKQRYNIIMYDVVTRDYNRSFKPNRIFQNVCRYTRNGSIIVFHDSLKAWHNMSNALPQSIEWLRQQGYELCPIPM
ncbi:MAG: polysaccharide deacetylase family protein [Muribaculaceae bacterium]|nr:polysaccharide deacetylase family protein [Muribaculaceae bacterium]